jgi:hypothetical protein
VKKHYQTESLPKLQKKYKEKVRWFQVVSSAKGKQGFYENVDEAAKAYKKLKLHSQAILMDTTGVVGRAYEAMTTPYFVILNTQGEVIYKGAVDSVPSADLESLEGAVSYVDQALEAHLAGKPIPMASTKSYGCSVKYEDN